MLLPKISFLLLLVMHCTSKLEEEVIVEDVVEENVTIFVPTYEWQHLLPGQSVPAGLHVRLNLQTGEREAKLIDKEDDKEHVSRNSDPRRLHHYGHSDRRGIINTQTKPFTVDGPLEPAGDVSSDNEVKLLSYSPAVSHDAEPKQVRLPRLLDTSLFTEDVKVMMGLVGVLRGDSTGGVGELLVALVDLEYLVHQIDNAVDFNTIGGLELVVKLLDHRDDCVQRNAAHVIGAAVQRRLV